MDIHFKIVVPFYNAEKWIISSLESVHLQDYENYECIAVDDCSTDRSSELVAEFIKNKQNFKLVRTEKNGGPLASAYRGALEYSTAPAAEDVVAILDGDDFLYGSRVLTQLNEAYAETDCWMTYGSYINLSDRLRGKFARKLPHNVIENNLYRDYEWCTSHMRTYKISLLRKVNTADLKSESGDFYRAAGDLALMFPLLEMSAFRSTYVKDFLYIWNDLNTLNEHKTKRDQQLQCEMRIRAAERYAPLET